MHFERRQRCHRHWVDSEYALSRCTSKILLHTIEHAKRLSVNRWVAKIEVLTTQSFLRACRVVLQSEKQVFVSAVGTAIVHCLGGLGCCIVASSYWTKKDFVEYCFLLAGSGVCFLLFLFCFVLCCLCLSVRSLTFASPNPLALLLALDIGGIEVFTHLGDTRASLESSALHCWIHRHLTH